MGDGDAIQRQWWMFALMGIVSIAAGVLAIAYPDVTVSVIGIVFGIYLLIVGVFELVEALSGDSESRALSAVVAVVALIAGLICLRHPDESLLALVIVLGVYLVVAGAVRLILAFGLPEHRGLGIVTALVDLALGVVILAIPDISLVTLAILFGISLIVRGLIACVAAWQLRRIKGADAAAGPPEAGGAYVL